jgi:predicted permease
MPDILSLFSSSIQSVIQVVLVGASGSILQLSGNYGKSTRKAISSIVIFLLLPALNFINVGRSVSVASLRTLYVLPLFAVFYLLIAFVISLSVANALTKKWYKFGFYHFILAGTVGNNNFIPLALAPAVINQGVFVSPLSLADQLNTVIGYIALFIVPVQILFWTFGSIMLKQLKRERELHGIPSQPEEERQAEEERALKWHHFYEHVVQVLHIEWLFKRFHLISDDGVRSRTPSNAEAGNGVGSVSDPRSRSPSKASGSESTSASSKPAPESSTPPSATSALSPLLRGFLEKHVTNDSTRDRLASVIVFFSNSLPPPALASILGIIIGVIAPIKNLLFSTVSYPVLALDLSTANNMYQSDNWILSLSNFSSSMSITLNNSCTNSVIRNVTGWYVCSCGSSFLSCVQVASFNVALNQPSQAMNIVAPLGPTLTSALIFVSVAAVPMVLLNIGSSLADTTDSEPTSSKGGRSGEQEDTLHIRTFTGVILIRLFIIPVIGILLVSIFVSIGIIDPSNVLLIFTLLLQSAVPSTPNLQLLCENIGSGARAMAKLIAYSYVVSIFILTPWITLFLYLINSGFFNMRLF